MKTIEKYPGTIYESTGLSEETIDKVLKDKYLFSIDDSDYRKFYNAYLVYGVPLSEIPEKYGISEKSCSAWASDMIPSIKMKYVENHDASEFTKKSIGFDIYKYAETYDADYYDPSTGYIYLVQEYNRALRFGLPTPAPGIRVMCDGVIFGVARRLD